MGNKVYGVAIAAVLILGMGLDGILAAAVDEEDEKISDLNVTQPVTTNVPPVVEVVPDVSSGKAPLRVQFEGDVYDEDGEITNLEWDFEGDGVFEVVNNLKSIERPQKLQAAREGLQKEHVYERPGIYHAVVRVTDDKEESTTASVTIQVYSDRPWLDVTPSNKDGFLYQAQAGYEAFFGEDVGKEIKFELNNAYITYRMVNQSFGAVNTAKGEPEGNKIWYRNVFPGVDIRYTVYEDLLLEEFVVYQPVSMTVIEQEFVTHGVDYEMEEDGSIGFYNGEDLVFSIPRPVMYEFNNPERTCYGLHYEVVEKGDVYILKKVIDDVAWLKSAKYPVVIDSSTQGEIADPWEQQGLTPYGQYFQNMNEYVDPLTGHLTIKQTDYSLSGRGLDLSISRVYSTVVAYKEEEDGSGEYVPIATYQEAPTDLGYGWSLDFPWLELNEDEQEPGHYLHLPKGVQIKTNFVDGVWIDETHHFTMYVNGDYSFTKYRDDGVREDYDSQGRLTSITDLNGNVITFSYGQYGISQITDTVGRTVTFNYSFDKLTSITDGIRTISYGYSGDKLTTVTDPIGRVTTYEYMSQNSFLITGVHYPSGGFSSYEYGTAIPEAGKIAPYKSSETEDGETQYYFYKVDSPDTVTWTSPKDLAGVTGAAGRPYVVQGDDGSFVMYFKEKYVWTETIWKCKDGDCWEEIITHTEYWIKRSTSTDQQHWSTPQNVLQVKSTTGNSIVIEKQDGSLIMYYMDLYQWTEEQCELVGRCPWDCEWVCETITHTEFYIYRRSSSDGITWGSPVTVQQTTVGVRNIAAIQKQDGTFLMVYMDKVGSAYYMRQKTSADGLSWGAASNVVQVDSGTGGPALLQADSGIVYLAYRKGNSSLYVTSNSGSGWSSPVQTTGVASGDPAFLQTETEIVLIYKGTDNYCYRISSSDGSNWSSPSQIAPNKIVSDPASVQRTDRSYRVTAQYISASALDLVKITEFSYTGSGYLSQSTDVLIRDSQTLKSSMHFEYDFKGRTTESISRDENGTQTEKAAYTYNNADEVIRQDVYAGTSTDISYGVIIGYDNHGNMVYTRDPEGAEHYYAYANTNSQNQFIDSKGQSVQLFSNQFYTNFVPSHCHTLLVGEAFFNSGKVTESYYKYDSNGNMIETKTLYPTRDYAVFSGSFDENGQTAFDIDLTGLTITDAILVISSIAVPTQETFYETHSEVGKGWLDTGVWSGKYFMADYYRCYSTNPPDCFSGSTKIGPFEHYPGTPNYIGYTTWVEENTQYVKTSYAAIINEYPEKVEYNLNNASWTVITDNLGSGTTSVAIPSDGFLQGINTMQFRESNAFSTQFEWTIYIDQGATPEDYLTGFAYDSYGNLVSLTDALNNTTFLGYDTQYHAYLTSITNALTNTVTATYDLSRGLVTSITDAKGETASFEYDSLGRVRKKINPDLSELEAVYDDQNSTVTIYDELDHYAIYSFDGLDRLIKSEWYLSPSVNLTETYSYDYLNKIQMKTDSGGHIYSYEYDSKGRLTRLINPDSTSLEAHYDDNTNTVTLIDENQYKKEYSYNWVNQLMQVKEYTDLVTYYLTQYTYDSAGNLTSFTDANGNITTYTYSLYGVTQITYPDSTIESYSYDAVGNTLQKIDANGVTALTYDAIYQLISIQYPDQVITFNYDANGNRISMIDSEGISTYSYDDRNRLLSETRTIMGDPYTVAYQYDPASNIESITYPDQSVVTYEYDSLDRIVNIPGYAQFTYDTDSLLATVTYANGVETEYEYNSCQRLTSLHAQKNGTDLLLMGYTYDAGGNIQQLEYSRTLPDQQWSESVEIYAYDWLDRLVSAQGDYGLLSYSYDAVGNRLSKNDLTYSYNSMNELLSISDGTSFTYDEMGNTLTKNNGTDTWMHTQDKRNELIKVEKNQNVITEYSYDGDGRRIKKTEWVESLQDYQTRIYVYSGQHVIYEKNLDTNQEATYVYGQTGRIAKNSDGLTDFYHSDHLGSTRLITDESGNALTAVDYDPLGKDVETGEKTLYTYNGKEKDETGLYYYGARYYDPEAGRFTSRDLVPGHLANPQTLNRYTYCLNNPLKYRDPDGCEQAGALLGKGNYPNLNNLGGPMSWSWAPQNIGKESPGDPGCLLAMLLLSGIAVSPLAVGLAKDIASFGADVVSLVCHVMKGVLKALSALLEDPLVKAALTVGSGSLLDRIAVTHIQTLRNILDLLKHLAGFWKQVCGFTVRVGMTDSLHLVVMVTFFNAKGEAICGSVAFSDGDRYVWKLIDGVYYVLINGEWVQMPEDWEVGDPLPGEC